MMKITLELEQYNKLIERLTVLEYFYAEHSQQNEKRGEGYWIGNYTPYRCSNQKCNHYVDSKVPYCPYCGNRNI